MNSSVVGGPKFRAIWLTAQSSMRNAMSTLGPNTLFVHKWKWGVNGNDWWKYKNRPHVTTLDLRAKGMLVVDNVDRGRFQIVLAPVYVDFGKRFGQDNIDRIKNYK